MMYESCVRNGLLSQLCRTTNSLRAHLERTVLRDEDLRWSEFDALALICSEPNLQVRAVVAKTGTSRARIAEILAVLVQREFVERRAGSAGRGDSLRPTPVGEAFAARVGRLIGDQERLILAGVPDSVESLVEDLTYVADRSRDLAARARTARDAA
ncbi:MULTISPECIES: MarR family winged helix-turn-helix transcriptional regulator [Asanoa]|uniref:HTH marR-type domain-containing protein n=2 Tax=Asanoa TaxID=195964 RepID=A0A239PFB7_9ACTN|nr:MULTISPECIES: MarR family winged helix-turn-helix transcriptional regulator [Asanoa]GIF74206.1 hypothetical protein Asi02nite_37240 [Asanoa siamensis]SNT65721.1 hypothetical protein SAMN05421812_12564 [Asanoa hainanensis]